jgi:predicted transcriptional regulator of viral defense system
MTKFWQEEGVRELVVRQHGRITWAQLKALGVSDGTIGTWTRDGYLTRVLPKVYAVGHTAPSREGDLWAAVLYAGPGAMLSHASAAHHRGLLLYAPREIHVSTPRCKIKSTQGIGVHANRDLERGAHEGIPTTTNAQTVLDLAADPNGLALVRRALAVLDFRNELDMSAIAALCGKGKRGCRALREALEMHQPELAHTNGELEQAFLYLCERFGLAVPLCNRWMCGFPVDAYWPDINLIVEVDGMQHSKPGQLRKDRRNELTLREHGHTVVRYDWALVKAASKQVAADLVRLGVRRLT